MREERLALVFVESGHAGEGNELRIQLQPGYRSVSIALAMSMRSEREARQIRVIRTAIVQAFFTIAAWTISIAAIEALLYLVRGTYMFAKWQLVRSSL